MTTKHLQELDERVAKALGWRPAESWVTEEGKEYWEYWIDPDGKCRRDPSDPAECARLCAEFNVWPYSGEDSCGVQMQTATYEFGLALANIVVEHDNSPTGRLNAATEAALLAILKIKEKS